MNNTGVRIIKAHTPFMGSWSAEFEIHTWRDDNEHYEYYHVNDNGLWQSKNGHEHRLAVGRDEAHKILADILKHASATEPAKMTVREFWIYVDGWCQGRMVGGE